MQEGRVIGIFVGALKSSPMQSVESAYAIAGRGLEGDRYCSQQGTIKKGIKHVTLIEEEALEAVRRDYGIDVLANETRRNVLTSGVALNHFVGKKFRVGSVLMRGVELSEPCGHLERLTGKKLREALVHRGGLRAEILSSGDIRQGSFILKVGSHA